MYTPLTFLRITAYHSVDASRVPWIGCQGRGGGRLASPMPRSPSCARVAT
jgi:hypothetical protein